MRRSSLVFLTASLLVHGGLFGSGAWLTKRAHEKQANSNPKVAFVGETFEIADDEQQKTVPDSVSVPDSVPVPVPDSVSDSVTRPRVATHGDPTSVHAPEVPLTFGALGDRSAVDVTVALVRGFPQAASTDPVWRAVPFGDAGTAILEIDLAEDGTLARWSLGSGASPALRQAFVRTMAFIGGRTFIARGAVTKLRVSARVTADAVRDGDDAVYAIHSEHDGPNASAYFSLSSGRRIDLVLKVDTSP